MRINHNIVVLNAYNHLNRNHSTVSKSMEKLTSGLRINRAADDAAGLAVSEKMRSQIRGLTQAERNILDGVSLVQIAEGGLQEIHNMLQRARELSVQASNDTLAAEDKEQIQLEIDQLIHGINYTSRNTNYNGIELLNITCETSNVNSQVATAGASAAVTTMNSQAVSPTWKDNVLKPPQFDGRGHIYLETNEGYPASAKDNLARIVYGNGSAGTSRPSVKIGDAVHFLDELPYDSSTGTFSVDDVKIKQTVNIAGHYKDKYEIKYEIINESDVAKEIGFLFHMDTMIHDDDQAPFIVDNVNYGPLDAEKVFPTVPNTFNVYNQTSNGNDELMVEGILKDTTITYGDGSSYSYNILTEPDKFGIGEYYSLQSWDWNGGSTIGDSGYGVWWNPRTVGTGDNLNLNLFYGLTVPPTIPDPPDTPVPTPTPEVPVDNSTCKQIVIQRGANKGDLFTIDLTDAQTNALQIDDLSVRTTEEAQRAIGKLDEAIKIVSTERSKWGAYQNALEHISSNVTNAHGNLSAAESRIRDTDMALEMSSFTKNNILNQSAQAMLAQANQLPQGILQLLK